jgi:DNA-directed RNA polymerase subunit RPC12/RpoP
MSETTALQKFACPACGAEAHWNPGRQALVCPYCGTVSPATIAVSPGGATLTEHDLVAALRRIPDDQRGWQAPKTSVKCQSCQAITVFDPERVAQRCDFCGSAALVPYEEVKEAFRPESVLPFKVTESQARDRIRAWFGQVWFAPNRLKSSALTDTVHGLYIPYWTFDAKVFANWTAEAGHYYYVTHTYRDDKGQKRTREERRVRWEPAAGSLEHFFDDELVAASMGVAAPHLRKIEPFPTTDLVAYDAGFVAGWVVERYQIDLVAAAQHSREVMDAKLEAMCAEQVPGDTHRNLHVDADYSAQTFKHILAPIWLLTYTFGARAFQVVINGFTGAISGDYPKSWIKIALAVIVALIVVLILYSLSEG